MATIEGTQVVWGIPSGRQYSLIITEAFSYEETNDIKLIKNESGEDTTRVLSNKHIKLDISGIATTAAVLPDIGATVGFNDKNGSAKVFRVISAAEEYGNTTEKKMKFTLENRALIDT